MNAENSRELRQTERLTEGTVWFTPKKVWEFEALTAHHTDPNELVSYGRIRKIRRNGTVQGMPRTVPSVRFRARSIASQVFSGCGTNIAARRGHVAVAGEISQRPGVHVRSAQRVRQVWRNVYSGKWLTFASVHAVACWRRPE